MLTGSRIPSLGRLAAPFVAMALIVGACSSGSTPTPAAATAPPSAAASSSAGGAYTVSVATSATVGKFLAGEDGKTLYTFSPDSANTSTCVDACAANWPPFALDPGETAAAGTGVTGTIATFKRADGSMQVSYNGKPLYYFKNDTKAGDTNGQGLAGGKWMVATP
jgi:predicted lipoprotein with Yx(FWY)xxD motif